MTVPARFAPLRSTAILALGPISILLIVLWEDGSAARTQRILIERHPRFSVELSKGVTPAHCIANPLM